MKIVDKIDATDKEKRTIFTINLENDKFIDVMVVFNNLKNPLIYIMQNEDGSTVYNDKTTYPDIVYNEEEILNFIKNKLT